MLRMSKLLLALLAVGLYAQNPNTAAFPNTVAADTDLLAAKAASQSTLSNTIDNSTTTVVVASGSAFLQYSAILIDSELMKITGISTNTLTVTRAFNSTSAASHTAGASVYGVISSYHHNQLAAEIKAMQARLRDMTPSCIDAGSNDTYACSPAPSLGSYSTGQRIQFKAATANTGVATVNFNSLGARTIKKLQGGVTTDLADNDIRAGQWITVIYDGTNMQMQSQLGNTFDASAYLLSATDQAGTTKYCRSTSGNDTYACSVTPALTTYTTGSCLVLNGDTANTGTATVNVNSLGARSILGPTGGALSNSDITANRPITICYDGTQYIIQGSSTSGSGDATKASIQAGSYPRCVSSNATRTYTCTMTPTLGSYTDGMVIHWKQTSMTTPGNGSSTLNIDGLGAKAVKWTKSSIGDSDTGSGGTCVPWQNTEHRLIYQSSPDAFLMVDCASFGQGNLGSAVRTDDVPLNTHNLCGLSGSSPTFSCTMNSISSVSAGMSIYLYAGTAITAAATVNVSSGGAVDLVQPDGASAPSAACPVPASTPTLVVLDGNSHWRMVSCMAAGSGVSTASALTDCKITYTSGTVISAGGCLGVAGASTSAAPSGDSTQYFYYRLSDSTLVVGSSTSNTATLTGWSTATLLSDFPADVIRFATITVIGGAWQNTAVDKREFLAYNERNRPATGAAVTKNCSGPICDWDVDWNQVEGKYLGTVNAQTGTSYTYLDSDYRKLVTHTNASAIAGTLPNAAGTGFDSGWWMDVQNRGAGTLTITPTTSTIDGASSLALTTGQGVRIYSDGTNYFTQRGMTGGSSSSFTYADVSLASLDEEFYSNGSPATQTIGKYGWITNSTSGTIQALAGSNKHPGMIRMRVSATVDHTLSMHLDADTGEFVMNAATFDYIWVLKTGGSVTEVQWLFGFADGRADITPSNSLAFNFTDGTGCTTGDGSDTTWRIRASSGGTATTSGSNMPNMATSTWYKFRMRSTVAGTVLFSACSGEGCTLGTETSVSTNIPSAAISPIFFAKNCNTTLKDLDIDVMKGSIATAR